MRIKVSLVFLCFCGFGFAQNEIKQNGWTSFQISKKKTASISLFDVGVRFNDRYIHQTRQAFVRCVFMKELNRTHTFLGGGIAYFEHRVQQSRTWDSELRPFLQFQSQKVNEKSLFKFRFRNDFRFFYERTKLVNRSRAQFQILQAVLIPALKFQLTEELFYSFTPKNQWENRCSVGFQYEVNPKTHIGSQYILQWQETRSSISQHIFALNINVSI